MGSSSRNERHLYGYGAASDRKSGEEGRVDLEGDLGRTPDYAQTMTVAIPVIPYFGPLVLFGRNPKR